MRFHETPLKGAYVIELEPFQDERGWFARTFCKREFEQIGHTKAFVQFNHSHSVEQGTLRGLHYQRPPHAEIKLIRCIQGRVFDVIVDIRCNSPTFLQYTGVELSSENKLGIYIPEGFAHGFQTLEKDTALIYHHTAYYQPLAEGGIRYNDTAIGIKWPFAVRVLSEKDQNHPMIEPGFKGITV